ncbi:ClpXP protease specificity-enhancing factor [Snodgrassella sp. CFCC 13594]|uniref:ClpXP protease specificity-enhancing factor n=1 Tax=Snodgrassella sp. CFCC 13594 TaxID=1775559 RepID=UPI00082E8FAB|nr:ClpXP protease specificity-enhancing factor [Snodgrassella sp. CFCC 13594]
MSELSTKPYLLRALYDWCADSGHTPYIAAWVNEQTQVPMQYVRDQEIVLNIGPQAANGLVIDQDWVHFAARFAGVSHDIWIPVGHVSSIFARETGEGMGFDVVPYEPDTADEAESGHLNLVETPASDTSTAEALPSTVADTSSQSASAESPKKGLKIIK